MKKFFVLALNLLFVLFAAFFAYNYYTQGLNSEVIVDCDYNYIIETNSMVVTCDVEDKDAIISSEHPLTLLLMDSNNMSVFEANLQAGVNNIDIAELDHSTAYSITISGYDFTSEEYIEKNLDSFDFSTVRETLNLPTYSITNTILFDTEYLFTLGITDEDECVDSVDVTLYNSSNEEVSTKNFTLNEELNLQFTNLNPESDYTLEISINYIINDFNELNEIIVPLNFTTTAPLKAPTAELSTVLDDNITLSFDILTDDNDASNVVYTVSLLNVANTVLDTEVITGESMVVDVSDISENYTIIITSSYSFKGETYTEVEMDSYSVYVNTLSNFFLIPTVHVVNTDLALTSYDDYDDYLFTYINQGISEFTITCESPLDCRELIENDLYSSIPLEVDHYVHSYFDIHGLSYSYSPTEINVTIEYEYTPEEMGDIDLEVTRILNSIINSSMTDYDKILAVHDYVVNNTVYDTACFDDITTCDTDHSALGVFVTGNAVCDGYASAMDILLRRLSIPSIRISSETHQWNAIYYNDSWLHLDATWDDPVTNNGTDVLRHDYFLISSATLASLDTTENHVYSTTYTNFVD